MRYSCGVCNADVKPTSSSFERACQHDGAGIIAHLSATATGEAHVRQQHPLKAAFLTLVKRVGGLHK